MSQAPNLGRLLRMLNLNHSKKITKWKIVEGICISRPSLLKASLYQPKRVNKFFLLKNSFNYECNLIHTVICQGCKEEYIGETGCVVKERINIYRQHIRQPQYQQLAVEAHLRFCGIGRFHMFPFFKIIQ